MRTTFASLLIVAVAAFGCGGKSKSGMTDPCKDKMMDGEHMEGEGEEHGEEHGMTPEMSSFHDVLAPLWHAEVGAQRTTDTCQASASLAVGGNDIKDAAAPEGADADAWAQAAQRLMDAIGELQAACSGDPGDAFEGAFGEVHEAFHGLLDLLPKG